MKLTHWNANFSDSDIAALRRSLLSWYEQRGRTLPWRNEVDPYKIWVSEIMLQQTQVKTVIPYYQRWLTQFPTVETLASADLQQVLKAWEGLGYYARGRNLHKAAQQVVEQQDGQFPANLEGVLALPGIGRTTAGGILSAAFNQPVSILDGNVKRVLARLAALPVPPAKALQQLWQLSDRLIDPEHPRDFNQAIMDLGAIACTPRNPTCLLCPWRDLCRAFTQGIQSQLPMRVAESTVILRPIDQLGCLRASSTFTIASFSTGQSRNAPPEAVRIMRRNPRSGTPWRHWKMAECSESAGSNLTP